MRKPQSKCQKCRKRYVGCHSECEEYLEYKRQLAVYYKERNKALVTDWTADMRPWMHRKKQ